VVTELDLHGRTQTEAERDVRSFIAAAARAHSGSVVRIITGKGRNSPGRAKLPSTVRRLLNGELKPYCADWDVDVDEGAVLVRLR
jgi:DNA-nicking Smr family endonuclease